MATKKKMLQAAAGSATGGAGLDITEVFSTYLYEGNSGTLSVNNGIDFSGEGGLVWIKNREAAFNHLLIDTARGGNKYLYADNAAAQGSFSSAEQFTLSSTGFSSTAADFNWNNSNYDYASWSFRKAPKFFDVVTWTGDGVAGRTIPHNLGTTVGTIIIKDLTTPWDWQVYHRSVTGYGALNNTDAWSSYTGLWNSQTPTDTEFYLGSDATVNSNGSQYVAYLFAHNDGDGEFGPDGDQDIIKCGSYTGDGTTNGTNEVTLGFEPQWILTKRSDSVDNWHICDVMRGQTTDGITQRLRANTSAAESGNYGAVPTPTGFKLYSDNSSGGTFIYMAIRRGPLAQPESGTEVFAIDTRSDATSNPPSYSANGIVDMALQKELNASGWGLWDRLRGQYRLQTHATNAEDGPFSYANFDHMDGWGDIGATDTTHSWMWKRAPGFFDVVAYTGNATAGRTVPHNLGVAPELMIAKTRDAANYWVTYDAASGPTKFMILNQTNGTQTSIDHWNNTAPTASVFTLGDGNYTNRNATQHIIYLFASLPGISKVGSYTGNGTSQTIDCGFTSGARFVLIKRTDSTGDWYVWDTERGIVAGNDPYLELNTTDAEVTSTDWVDPDNSGFIVNGTTINASSAEYIFYAVS